MQPKYSDVVEGDDDGKHGINGSVGIAAILLTMHLHRIPITMKIFREIIVHVAPPFLRKVRERNQLDHCEKIGLPEVILPLNQHNYFPNAIEYFGGNIMGDDLDRFLELLGEMDEGGAIVRVNQDAFSILKMVRVIMVI